MTLRHLTGPHRGLIRPCFYYGTVLDSQCPSKSRRTMYDDYDFDYTFTNDYGDLEEDLDEDYARDSQDYQELAYRHYA